MFIISFKVNKYKIIMTVVILLVIAAVVTVGYHIISNKKEVSPTQVPVATVDPNENQMVVRYIEGFGWKLDPKPVETEEFQIPNEFDTVYKKYNQYQHDIGSDLNNYKGKIVKRYTYKVLNYKNPPQYAGQQVYADALVYNGKVIAGDLKTNQLNGFMVSLTGKTFKEITGIDESMFR